MDSLTLQLFGRFPREISLFRKTIYNIKDFKNYIQFKSGIEDIYTSVYPSNFIIDKIFFDFDWGPDVLGDTKKVFKYCQDQGWQPVPIISGKKGYHLYIPVAPEIHSTKAKIRLLRAHYSIIENTFGEFRQETIKLKGSKEIQVFKNKDGLIGPDPTICGDVRQICRVPNTLRPPDNINYCTYIDPDKFLEMTELDIIDYMKSPHQLDIQIDFRHAPKLQDFNYDFKDPPEFDDTTWTPLNKDNDVEVNIQNKYLKTIMRPCVYRHIAAIHPGNYIRFCAALDLLFIGLSPEKITSIFSSLGWEDFDANTTLSRIEWIKSKMISNPELYHPPSCGSLRHKGIPLFCCESERELKK